MCYYQNIHTAYHSTLLGFDPSQQEHHACGLAYPSSGSSFELGGDKCVLHSCCAVKKVLIVQCRSHEEVCPHSLVEDVFVPFPAGEERVLIKLSEGEVSTNKVETGPDATYQDRDQDGCGDADESRSADGPFMMKFWRFWYCCCLPR